MHTRLDPDNPFGCTRSGFAWERVPRDSDAHLDFGCHDGEFLSTLAGKSVHRLVGLDISREAVETARKKFSRLDVMHLTETVPLPLPDKAFSSITILDVIEHVHEQQALLRELHRVLTDDGVLIITVPGQHFFSWLDIGNLKFRFPRLHRWHYCRTHSLEEYEYRYISNPDGLVGDISAAKRWHEHFSRTKLDNLLGSCGFSPIEFDGTGFFTRAISAFNLAFKWVSPNRPLLRALQRWDTRRFESMNLFCVAEKRR